LQGIPWETSDLCQKPDGVWRGGVSG